MRHSYAFLAAPLFSLACSASLRVRPIVDASPEQSGLVYALPQTVLDLRLRVVGSDYVAGPLEKAAGKYQLTPLRPSAITGVSCKTDSPASERRFALSARAIATYAVPDPERMYLVQIGPGRRAKLHTLLTIPSTQPASSEAPAPEAGSTAPAADRTELALWQSDVRPLRDREGDAIGRLKDIRRIRIGLASEPGRAGDDALLHGRLSVLAEEEGRILRLFEGGTSSWSARDVRKAMVPARTPEGEDFLVGYFSPCEGWVDADSTAEQAREVRLSLEPLPDQADTTGRLRARAEAPHCSARGIAYSVPMQMLAIATVGSGASGIELARAMVTVEQKGAVVAFDESILKGVRPSNPLLFDIKRAMVSTDGTLSHP